jgi:serine/threonine-protein kinase HipA
VINHLLTNTDDHLWSIVFLHAGHGQWSLAPAFDVNPSPDKARESKMWLSEDTGPVTSLQQVPATAGYLGLTPDEARATACAMGCRLERWGAETRPTARRSTCRSGRRSLRRAGTAA